MERIMYRKTLDVHKNGVQFMLQGFETADNLSRVIEISLMASGDAIDFPLERMVAMMYVTTPGATEPSINECTIKDNKVVYEMLPIIIEGITTMQLKLIETSPEGAKSVLATPKFSVEVTKSDADDESAEQSTTFTALEDAMAKAKTVYDERFLRMELSSDCIFRAYYADGTVYETDVLQKLFLNGNVLLSESFAHGGTGVRAGEDTDNSMFYSNVSRSEALNAKAIMENSEEILEEVKLHGVYTAFSVDFETGEVEYVSPSFKFKVNMETGELEADGQTYTFEEELCRIVADWLAENGVVLSDLQAISTTHTEEIEALKEADKQHTEDIETANNDINRLRGLEWTTLGSVTYSKDTKKYTNKERISEVVTIPCDESLFKEFDSFRYVIKNGASFYGYGVFSTDGNGSSPFSIAISESTLGDLFVAGVAPHYSNSGSNNEPEIELDFTATEDIIIHTKDLGSDMVRVAQPAGSGYFGSATTNSPSSTLTVTMGYYETPSEYASGKHYANLGCSFTIELQGKR